METDSFLWLEDLASAKASAWAEQETKKTLLQLREHELFPQLKREALEVIKNEEVLLIKRIFRKKAYLLRKTVERPLGDIWMSTLADLQDSNKWKKFLDLDLFQEQDQAANYFSNLQFSPDGSRALLTLSPNGGDKTKTLEIDAQSGELVADGFNFQEGKGTIKWLNCDQVLYDCCEVSTADGYPAEVFVVDRDGRRRKLAEIPKHTPYVAAFAAVFDDRGRTPLVVTSVNWDERQYQIEYQGKMHRFNFPRRTWCWGLFKDKVVISLQEDWSPYVKGSVLIARNAFDFNLASSRDFELIYAADTKANMENCLIGQEAIYLLVMENLKSSVLEFNSVLEMTRIEAPSDDAHFDELIASQEGDVQIVSYQSFNRPKTHAQILNSRIADVHTARTVFDASKIRAHQLWATSSDGTQVPYWLVTGGEIEQAMPKPTVQYGYGGFESSLWPEYFGTIGKQWLEKGGQFVLAQIRGGCELGLDWHRQARLHNKQKSYDDFIAISEDLIHRGVVTPSQLAINGRSNGGLLTGAVLTQRPDLFGAAVIEVPLLDMMRFADLPPGASWVAEYGDPRLPEFAPTIRKYSPYQNIERNQKYPPVLIRTSRSDDRVHPGHARKMAAKMLALGHVVYYYEETEGGHGATNPQDLATQTALKFTFLWQALGGESLSIF